MKTIKLILTVLAVLLVFSCGQQDGGLFFSLEQEAAIYNGTLPNNITIGSMEKNADYYFIAAGKFMYIAETDAENIDKQVEWTKLNPAERDEYLCYNMIKIDNIIYAVFYNIDTVNFEIFSIDVSSPSTSMSWSSALSFTDTTLNNETVIDFAKANSKLFIYTKNSSNKYSVFATDLASFAPGTATFDTIKTDINAGGEFKVDFDNAGSTYWIVAGNMVLSTDGATAGADKTPGNSVSKHLLGKGFGGIVCADTDTATGTEVFLTSEEGVMLKYISGVWTVLSCPYDEDNGLFEPLKGLTHITVSSDAEDINIIIAGSEKGYYEMQFTAPTSFVSAEKIDTSLTTYNQFSSIDLSEKVVLDFYFDEEAEPDKIFALCYNGGLWKNSFKDNSYRFWDLE